MKTEPNCSDKHVALSISLVIIVLVMGHLRGEIPEYDLSCLLIWL